MEIKYLGHASFYLKTSKAKVITDPFDPSMVGLPYPAREADIVTVSHQHQDHNFLAKIKGEPLVIDLPGEYEKKGVRITGFLSYHDKKKGAERGENILFKFEIEGVNILHCGDLGLVPEEEFIEELGEVDILLIPVGGIYTIDPKEAVTLIRGIEPSIVIPMHYNHDRLNQEVFGKLSTLEDFLKEMGIPEVEPQESLKVKKEDLTGELQVVVLKIAGL